MTTEPSSQTAPEPGKGRKRLRRTGRVLLILLLLAAIFHRPILRTAIRIAAVRIAAKQHIHLELTVSGNALGNLRIDGIHARPTGDGPSPVERMDIESVAVNYDLIGFLRHGMRSLLRSYSLRNATIIVRPIAGTPSQKESLSATLSEILQQPALLSDRVDVRNLNLTARTPDGNFELAALDLSLDPEKEGVLSFDRLAIPRFHTYGHVSAVTRYAGRNLVVRNLRLEPELEFKSITLDASRRAQGIDLLSVEGTFFGSETSASLFVHQHGKRQVDARATLSARSLDLERLSRYLHSPIRVSGTILEIDADLAGDPDSPASLQGRIKVDGGPILSGSATVDRIHLQAVAAQGEARVEAAEIVSGSNMVTFTAASKLPQRADNLSKMELDGQLHAAAEEPGRVVPDITSGRLGADGAVSIHGGILRVSATGTGLALTSSAASVSNATFQFNAARRLHAGNESAPFFDGLETDLSATLSGIEAFSYAADSVTISGRSAGARVTMKEVSIRRAENRIEAHGEATLPANGDFSKTAFSGAFNAASPNLTAFNAEPSLTGLNGEFTAEGEISGQGKTPLAGHLLMNGTNLRFQEFTAEGLNVKGVITRDGLQIETARLALSGTDGVSVEGRVSLEKPIRYEGHLAAGVRDLAVFNPLLEAAGAHLKIGGTLRIDWTGKGDQVEHTGKGAVSLDAGQFGEFKPVAARIEANYSPVAAEVPVFSVNTPMGNLDTVIHLKDRRLQVPTLTFVQGKTTVLSGTLSFPLDLRNVRDLDALIPADAPLAINLWSKDLNIVAFKKGKAPAPFSGLFTTTFTAGGTINDPVANLRIEGRELKSGAARKLAAASLDVTANYAANQVNLSGTVSHPQIKPLEINGLLPLPLKKVLRERKLDDQTAVQFSVKLPASSTAFLSNAVPSIRYAEGEMALDAHVAGTLGKPVLSGNGTVSLNAIRFLDPTFPAVSAFRAEMRFTENELTLDRFGGDISGGPFSVTGRVRFANLLKPELSLRVTSREALLVRNDSLTVRADSDIKVEGPLTGAYVSGTVGITRSRFFREVDLLPIELPGRPAPKPPTEGPIISLGPPLRDWTFDVAVKTKDPFMVRGNLTNGSALVDLHLGGTGMYPGLDGTVVVENFVASLPFSKLNVAAGYFYFSSDDPFVPKLDIQGSSSMRDYNINVYISGTPANPQTVFTSEPPLPQEDIIALLATGATSKELSGSGGSDVLAGRAVVLIFQKYYRKVFKQKEPTENESFTSRFTMDVGAVDPRTGRQELSTRFKLGDKFYLIGDLDVQGAIRGQVSTSFDSDDP